MTSSLRCVLTLVLIYMPAFFLYRVAYLANITRRQFAGIMAFVIGLQLFLLTIMFVENQPIVVGVILLLLAFLGVYPIAYASFPTYRAWIEKRLIKKS